MHSFESKTHSFIVKIWLEEIAHHTDNARWRGHITHVPDGARRYLESVNEIPEFISPYLKGDDEKINLLTRLKQWLNP